MGKNNSSIHLVDQMGRSLTLNQAATRIISLVPSITELLSFLGLDDVIVGITKFCVHPKQLHKTKPKIGGTKQVHFDRVQALQPDLIICNKEENSKELIQELEHSGYTIYISDIVQTEDALSMITDIGALTGKEAAAQILSEKIKTSFNNIRKLRGATRPKVAYFIWNKPMMIAGNNTYIDSILHLLGFENAFKNMERYPAINMNQIKEAAVDLVLLSSEPFPFKAQHVEYFRQELPKSHILLVNGEIFSWYGSYMLQIEDYYKTQLVQFTYPI